jgi:hypothetical protein
MCEASCMYVCTVRTCNVHVIEILGLSMELNGDIFKLTHAQHIIEICKTSVN